MPKSQEKPVLQITSRQIQFKIYMSIGVVVPVETIKKVRAGERSQITPTGKMIMNADASIRDYFENGKF